MSATHSQLKPNLLTQAYFLSRLSLHLHDQLPQEFPMSSMLVAFFWGFSVMGSDVGHIDTTDPLKTAQRGGRTFSSTVSAVVKVANKNNKHGLANENKSKHESWIRAVKKS